MINRNEDGTIRLAPRGRWLAGLLIGAVAIGLIAAWLARSEFKGRYAIPEWGADRNATVPQIAATTAPAAPVASPPPARVRPAPPPLPPMVAEQDDPAAMQDEDDGDAARMARSIDKAARKALRRGETVRWHKAGKEGYVVVSDIRDYGDRACRNVSATINGDTGPTQSSAHLWCTTPNGDWAPANG